MFRRTGEPCSLNFGPSCIMTILTKSQDLKPIRRRLSSGLGYAYATLGLRAGEARVDAIRRAATLSSGNLKQAVEAQINLIPMLADVATSTYRLLDPRKRVVKAERIQLCLISEGGMELQQKSRRSFLPPAREHHSASGMCDLSA